MLENQPSPSQGLSETEPQNVPSLPPLPNPLDELLRNPSRACAIPSFLRLEELNTSQILLLLEKLELPINEDGLAHIDTVLRKSMNSLTPSLFFDAQVDGCTVNVLFTQRFYVGKNSAQEVRSVTINPDDLTAPKSYIKITLDTHNVDDDHFNLTLDFNDDQIYAYKIQAEVWDEIDQLLIDIEVEPLPAHFEHLERDADYDNNENLCVIAACENGDTFGILPLQTAEMRTSAGTIEEPEPTEKPSITTRMPQAIYLKQPSVEDLRIIAREFGDGKHSQFSVFDDARGDDSFLNNAVRLVREEGIEPVDLNAWEMYGFAERIGIFVNRAFTIGNSEYETGMAHTAVASNIDDYDPNDHDLHDDAIDEDEVDDDEDEREPFSYGKMSETAPPDISIFPPDEGTDVSLAISMENGIFSDEGTSERTLTASLHFGAQLSLQQRWAIVDRLAQHFDDTVITSEPNINQLPPSTPYLVIERVGLLLSTR